MAKKAAKKSAPKKPAAKKVPATPAVDEPDAAAEAAKAAANAALDKEIADAEAAVAALRKKRAEGGQEGLPLVAPKSSGGAPPIGGLFR